MVNSKLQYYFFPFSFWRATIVHVFSFCLVVLYTVFLKQSISFIFWQVKKIESWHISEMGIFKLLPQLFIYIYRGLNDLCFMKVCMSNRTEPRNVHYESCGPWKQSVWFSDIKHWNLSTLFLLFGCRKSLETQKSQGLQTVALTWFEILSSYLHIAFYHLTKCLKHRPCVLLLFVSLHPEHYLVTTGTLKEAATYLSKGGIHLFLSFLKYEAPLLPSPVET